MVPKRMMTGSCWRCCLPSFVVVVAVSISVSLFTSYCGGFSTSSISSTKMRHTEIIIINPGVSSSGQPDRQQYYYDKTSGFGSSSSKRRIRTAIFSQSSATARQQQRSRTHLLATSSSSSLSLKEGGRKRTTATSTKKLNTNTVATSATAKFLATTVTGPDRTTKPDYHNIHGPLGKGVDDLFLAVFRHQLAYYVGVDSSRQNTDYAGLIELSSALNARYSNRTHIQTIAQQTLRTSFCC